MQTYNLSFEKIIDLGLIGVRIFIIVMMIIYVIYTVILSRRIKIMNQNLKTPYEKSFIKLSKLHVFISIAATTIAVLAITL
jgi:hypothetical protein